MALQNAGYRTALMGKYLNEYMQVPSFGIPENYVPPGWSEWDVAGWGYSEYDYDLNENGTVRALRPRTVRLPDQRAGPQGVRFIDSAASTRAAVLSRVATFAPHSPYIPAPRTSELRRSRAPGPPSFDRLPTNAPLWRRTAR